MTKFLTMLLPAIALVSAPAAVADVHSGTVNITGTISAHTCEVAAESKDFTVALGQYHPQDFLQAGATTSMQPFTITLEKCAPEVTTATVLFSGESDPERQELLKIDATAENASGIAVAILDDDRTIIPLKSKTHAYQLGANALQIFHLPFYAQYVATHVPVTPGDASATATFQLYYE